MDGSQEGLFEVNFCCHDPGEAMNLAKQMLHREDFFGGRMDDFQFGVCVFFRVLSGKCDTSRLMVLQKLNQPMKITSRKKRSGKIFQEFLFGRTMYMISNKVLKNHTLRIHTPPQLGLVVETSHPHNRIVRLIPFLGHTNGSLGIVVPHMSVLYWFALVLVSPPQFLRLSSYGYESYIRI